MDVYSKREELSKFLGDLKRYKEVLINPNSILTEDKKKDYPFLEAYLPKESKEELVEKLRERLREELVPTCIIDYTNV